jgi:hypothetical protein
VKRLTTEEARDLGVVLEVNRQLLHPRGLALEVLVTRSATDEEATVTLSLETIARLRELLSWGQATGLSWPEETVARIDDELATATASPAILRVQDHRGDPEGVYFDPHPDDAAKAERFDALRLGASRVEALGYDVQPIAV